MLTLLTAPQVPSSLRGALIVDDYGLPRYWASIWLLMSGAELAASSQIKRLRYVESLYGHSDRLSLLVMLPHPGCHPPAALLRRSHP